LEFFKIENKESIHKNGQRDKGYDKKRTGGKSTHPTGKQPLPVIMIKRYNMFTSVHLFLY
jgi:hypothetical protein